MTGKLSEALRSDYSLLCVAFMIVARLRSPESLRYYVSEERRIILGHDGAPEAKTLRRKIRLNAGTEDRGLQVQFQSLGNGAKNRHIVLLLTELKAAEAIDPVTDLRAVYTSAATTQNPDFASVQTVRDQDL